MKNVSILILLIFFGCEKSKEDVFNKSNSDEPIRIYTWEDYEKVKHENPEQQIIIVDTICPFEIKRAENDIKNGKLVYTCYRPMVAAVINELDLLLKKYKMRAEKGSTSCIAPPKGFKMLCYQERMQKEIEKKYSQKWIDSLEELAIKNYVIKNPNQAYDENGIDLRTKYINK